MILPRFSFPRSSYNSSIGLPAKGDGCATKHLAKQLWRCPMSSKSFEVAGFYDSGSAPPLLEEPPVPFTLERSECVQATSKSMLLSAETCIFHCKRIISSPQLSPIKSHTHSIRLCFAHHSYKAGICWRPNSLTHCQTTLILGKLLTLTSPQRGLLVCVLIPWKGGQMAGWPR